MENIDGFITNLKLTLKSLREISSISRAPMKFDLLVSETGSEIDSCRMQESINYKVHAVKRIQGISDVKITELLILEGFIPNDIHTNYYHEGSTRFNISVY